jgi:hypothetical protein
MRITCIALLLLTAGALRALHADLKVDVYGYVKLDIQYNSKNTGSFPSPSPTSVPLDTNKAAQHGELLLDARESRIGVKATDTYKKIKLLGVVEGDFFTGSGNAIVSNSRGFRLRQAYMRGELPSSLFLLAGQYWSLFMNSEIAQPNLVDFNGPVGALFARQPQLRIGYTKKMGPRWGDLLMQADIEKHAFNTLGIVDAATDTDTSQGSGQRLPVFVAKLSWLLKHFQIEIAGAGSKSTVVKNLKGAQTQGGVWGVQSSAQYTWKKITLYGSIHHVDGLECLANEDFIDAVLLNGRIRFVKSNGWYVGGAYNFTPQTSFNIVRGWEKASKIAHSAFSGNAVGHYWSIHANILHQFWERWQTGIEFERFEERAFDGTFGDVNIYHFALWYFF